MYKSGNWGPEAKKRSRKRLGYFRQCHKVGKGIGFIGEKIVSELLNAEWLREQGGCDLLWNGFNVDVKTSRLQLQPNSKTKRWRFALWRQKRIADYFCFVCLNKKDEPIKIYLIPSKLLKVDYFSLSLTNNRYNKYLLKFMPETETPVVDVPEVEVPEEADKDEDIEKEV